MTGGRVVVLGPTGRNFAAGMSAASPTSGTRTAISSARCNLGMVELETAWTTPTIARAAAS